MCTWEELCPGPSGTGVRRTSKKVPEEVLSRRYCEAAVVPTALKSVREGRAENAEETLRCSASFVSPHWWFPVIACSFHT